MKKAKVFGIIKDTGLLIVEIEKRKYSLMRIRDFLVSIKFSKVTASKILSKLGEPDNNYSSREYKNALYQDLLIRVENGKGQCEVIFGGRKIFLIIRMKGINKISPQKFETYFEFK